VDEKEDENDANSEVFPRAASLIHFARDASPNRS